MAVQTKKPVKPKRTTKRAAIKLGRELWGAAVKYRRAAEGFDDGGVWNDLNKGQRLGWEGVGMYVAANFTRKKLK